MNDRTKRIKTRYLLRQKIAPYFFAAPYFIVFLAFFVFPFFSSLFASLNDWHGFDQPVFIGIGNYLEVLRDQLFYKALSNTFLLILMVQPAQLAISFLIANLLNSKMMFFKKAFRLIVFLPYLTTPIAIGTIFSMLFDPAFGVINKGLTFFGINAIGWFSAPWAARALVAIVTVWHWTGYTAVIFLAGMTNINTEIYEACEIDGANAIQKIFRITIPLLKPVITFVIITSMIGCFQLFDEPYIIFSATARITGGPDNSVLTGVWLFYETAFSNQYRNGYASAIAIYLFIAISAVSLLVNRIISGKKEQH
jgi:ABC-type sugar transport system permease subunit